MTTFRRRLANGLGLLLDSHIIPRRSAPAWPEAYFVERMFSRLKPDCVFDVGANRGQYGKLLRSQGFKGLIFSFEPNPQAFAELEAICAQDTGWHCYPYALGREAGLKSFNVANEDVFSSFLQPKTGSEALFGNESSTSATIEVRVETLAEQFDKLRSKHGFSNPFLKMDTQGFDLEVFSGGGEHIRSFCGLLSEVAVKSIYEDSPDMFDSIKMYADHGFELSSLFSVHAWLPLKTIEFNCYCVRSDLAAVDRID